MIASIAHPSPSTCPKRNGPLPGVPAAPHVLVVEDDVDIREPLARALRHEGYAVHTFGSGSELVGYLGSCLLRSSRPRPRMLRGFDAIVTDVRMPGISGIGIVQGLRAEGWSQPVVVMSAFADEALRRRIDRLDDVAFVAKPFEIEEIGRTLHDLMLHA